jgi:hypothetical protein
MRIGMHPPLLASPTSRWPQVPERHDRISAEASPPAMFPNHRVFHPAWNSANGTNLDRRRDDRAAPVCQDWSNGEQRPIPRTTASDRGRGTASESGGGRSTLPRRVSSIGRIPSGLRRCQLEFMGRSMRHHTDRSTTASHKSQTRPWRRITERFCLAVIDRRNIK